MYELNETKVGDIVATCKDCQKRFKMSFDPTSYETHERLLTFYTFEEDVIQEPTTPTPEELLQADREFMKVSPLQACLMLEAEGLLDGVEAYILTLDKTAQLSWNKATSIDRLHPLVDQVLPVISDKTPEEIDEMFKQALDL